MLVLHGLQIPSDYTPIYAFYTYVQCSYYTSTKFKVNLSRYRYYVAKFWYKSLNVVSCATSGQTYSLSHIGQGRPRPLQSCMYVANYVMPILELLKFNSHATISRRESVLYMVLLFVLCFLVVVLQ